MLDVMLDVLLDDKLDVMLDDKLDVMLDVMIDMFICKYIYILSHVIFDHKIHSS